MPRKQKNSRHSASKGPSQRQLRVGEVIRHALSDLLRRDPFRDPVLRSVSITVSEVRAAADLRHAKVYCAPLAGENQDEVLKALNRSASYMRKLLGDELTLKYTPELVFVLDVSFDEASRINALLSTDQVAHDLAQPDADVPDEDESQA
jgi:ribosome-binding factor A